ncbi:MAG: class I SAM-dependent methyltransferase [Myxococcaceae bacterium]
MNPEHLELLASAGWRSVLRDLILPYALADSELGDDVLEIGPGPGLTTELLLERLPRLTTVEIDDDLASALSARLADANVEVVHADATAMPFEDGRFTGAVSFTMLHHVPTTDMQDKLFTEVARVLQPGAVFVASDSVASNELESLHHGDIYNPVDPRSNESRLLQAGFSTIEVRSNDFGWATTARRGHPFDAPV